MYEIQNNYLLILVVSRFCGSNGIPGVPGNPGRDGATGSRGPAGEKGEPGERGNDYVDLVKSNWKQCAWNKTDYKDSGLIQV